MKADYFNEQFLDLLICPKSGQQLFYDKVEDKLYTKDGRISYEIKEGIPKFI